jgi:transposase
VSWPFVGGYLSRARAAGVSWRLAADLDDVQLEALLSPPPPAIAADQRPIPDWAWVHRELRRPNVTLALLWEEYRAGAPAGARDHLRPLVFPISFVPSRRTPY